MQLSIDKGVSDWIRFLSALMIAFHHYSQYALSVLHETGLVFKAFSAIGGYLGVAVFFFLSGYGLMESELKRHLTFIEFVKKRFSKIYLPVLLVTLLWVAVHHIFDINPHFSDRQVFAGGGWYLILFGFYDGVLWFVKVLLMLYLAFGAFAALRIENKISAWLLFASITIAIQILTKYCIGRHAIMSIPFFAIGVFASEFKEKCLWAFNVSILPLVVYPAIAVTFLHMHSVVIINSAVMTALIIALTLWKPKVACPAVLSSLAFDIYLVHNKVLMTGRTYTDIFPVWEFVTFTIVAALVFYFIRTLLLRPRTLIKSIK